MNRGGFDFALRIEEKMSEFKVARTHNRQLRRGSVDQVQKEFLGNLQVQTAAM